MNSARDELATLVTQTADSDGLYVGHLTAERIAGALIIAGYRRPRTITTAEELDALPEDTVIRTSGHEEFAPRVAVKTLRFDSKVSYWHVADADDFESTSDELDDLPATVLYEPEPKP